VIAAGVFDGLHLGHQAVLHAAFDAARGGGGTAVVLTFDPHPAHILRPGHAPRLLTSSTHKLRLMAGMGVESVLLVTFDEAFSTLEPEDFIGRLRSASPMLSRICVGQGWRFGRARRGDVVLLHKLGVRHGFQTTGVEPVSVDGRVVSSTIIRRAVEAGDLAAAQKLLGRDYAILGTVRRGEGLGHQLGFPTANLAAHNEQFPPDGVYAAHVLVAGQAHAAVANIGTRPTVSPTGPRLLEVHIPGFARDIYDQDIEVIFRGFLRPEKKFPDLESLRAQIAADVARAGVLLAGGN
jgi:riboflavin kinase/FMN adenylyltransferase